MLTATTLTILAIAVYMPAFAQYPPTSGGDLTVTPKQLEECKSLGIPQFTCTQQTILAKKRIIEAEKPGAYGSGTAMFGKSFGEMGAFVAALGTIFGGVAAAFFAKARMGRKVPI